MDNDPFHEQVLRLVDDVIQPGNLSQRSALSWLEDLIPELETRANGLRADLRRSGE